MGEPVKVERNRIWANVGREHALELVEIDSARAITVCRSPGVSCQASVECGRAHTRRNTERPCNSPRLGV